MSDIKFSQLPAAAAMTGAEIVPAIQGGSAVQITPAAILALPAANKAVTGQVAGINSQTGTAYTLQASDVGVVVAINNANPIAVTVPEGFKQNQVFFILQQGAGQITLSAANGVTLTSASTLETRTVNSMMALVYLANDIATVVGDIA